MNERRYVIESDGFIIGAHDPPYRILPVTKVAAIEYATTSSTASVHALVPLSELEAMERERADMLALLHRVVFAEGDLTIEETKMVESFIARAEGKP